MAKSKGGMTVELIDGLQKHKKLQELFEKVERRINEGDSEDAAVNMRKMLEYFTSQYVKEFAQQLVKNDLFTTINGLQDAGIIPEETASLFHKIRMMANKGAAHLSSGKIPIAEVQGFYDQLLTFVPSFLSELPEPSKKKVKDNPFNIDYLKITPLRIDFPNYGDNLEFNLYFSKFENHLDEHVLTEKEIEVTDSLYWLYSDTGGWYTYEEAGKTYINRLQLVIDTEEELNNFLSRPIDDDIVFNEFYIPAVIQEYFGFSRIHKYDENERVQGANGVTAIRRGKTTRKVKYNPINPERIIAELASFSKQLVIPDCITKISNLPFYETFRNITEIRIPATMSADQSFDWLKVFKNKPFITIESGSQLFIKDGVIYRKDTKEVLYDTKNISSELSNSDLPQGCYVLKNVCNRNGKMLIDRIELARVVRNDIRKIEELYIPEGVTCISNEFVCWNWLKKIHLPSTLSEIQGGAFQSTGLIEIYIPDGVISIGNVAFKNARNLKKVRIPATIREIADTAFDNCISLREVEIPQKFRYIFGKLNIQYKIPKQPSKEVLKRIKERERQEELELKKRQEEFERERLAKEEAERERAEKEKAEIKALPLFQRIKRIILGSQGKSPVSEEGSLVSEERDPVSEERRICEKYPFASGKFKSKEGWAKDGPSDLNEYIIWVKHYCSDTSSSVTGGIKPYWISIGALKFNMSPKEFVEAIKKQGS